MTAFTDAISTAPAAMSFASFAIGSNDVVAMSIAASMPVFSISAISTNVIEISERDQLQLRHVDDERSDQHEERDHEVDPHVPLRAEDVDDPLERVVERVEDRQAHGARSREQRLPRGLPSRRRARSRAGAAGRA